MARELTVTFAFDANRLFRLSLAGVIVAIPPNLVSQQTISETLSATFPAPIATYGRILTTGREGHTVLSGTAGSRVGIGLPATANPTAQVTLADPTRNWRGGLLVEENPAAGQRTAVYQSDTNRLMFSRISPAAGETNIASFSNGGMVVGSGWANSAPPANGLAVQGHAGIGAVPAGALPNGSLVVAGVIGDGANTGCWWENRGGGGVATNICANPNHTAMAWEFGGAGSGRIAECSTPGPCTPSYSGRVLCCRLYH